MGVLSILAGLQAVSLRVLQELSTLSDACARALSALDNAKADKVKLIPLTIPAADWQHDANGYYIDLSVSGLTDTDCVAVLIAPESQATARAAVLDTVCDSRADALRLRAWYRPSADLTAHYYLIREDILMAQGPVALGGSSYTLPPATSDTLGGVMVGKNITNKDGTISLTGENVVAALTYTPATKDEATQTTPGLLSAADKAKLDSLDGSGSIAASGTNYVRFTDGTQICWGKIASGSTKFSFPAAFIDTNYAFGYMSTGTYTLPNGSMSDSKVDSRYVSSCTTTGLSLVSSGGGIRLIVIGRWK